MYFKSICPNDGPSDRLYSKQMYEFSRIETKNTINNINGNTRFLTIGKSKKQHECTFKENLAIENIDQLTGWNHVKVLKFLFKSPKRKE